MSAATLTPERTTTPVQTYAPPPVPRPTRERLLSLDVFRGMTIAGMLLVNDPGTWSAIYPPLEHATWNGWTPTDLIFPFFLFIAGITTHLSLEAAQPSLDPAVLRDVPSKVIVLGVLDLGSSEAETPELVAERIRRALEVVPPERLVVAPDCGMKYLPRDVARGKLRALVHAAAAVRAELL